MEVKLPEKLTFDKYTGLVRFTTRKSAFTLTLPNSTAESNANHLYLWPYSRFLY